MSATTETKSNKSNVVLLDPATTLIRIPEVMAIVGLARPTIYKLMRRADSGFPLPVKLSHSNARGAPVAWVLSEVQEWVRGRIAARGQVAA
ncbi:MULTISPECIES: helix-turn-helix transcriptional regulator [Pseudomonas]|uniref:helix-turn-helix transcriptional regulator n=1 Tax=Pseudomonas TaxID=286 RepID=UPI0008984544|nr:MULTISPECIES: AlpA family phage regulatory protein [Pseudomonas]KAA8706345.1 AlpA family phage regulatory protein [Pseudomonas proteolytica]MCR8934798.1 AlpA family phage regulatory protein [Pseudomonas sp. S11A4]MCR8973056.1 AlpA family phage regulatory protein [Pseudomonas sp. S11P7]TWR84257.1 AlpA family phage regulatory protein [Pseudomonas proteolytica]SED75370.1 transcriptional regulator, AlpA family [Pseudomonas proteolytica]